MTSPARLREMVGEATAKGEWQLQDGCSWRRIGTPFHDGDVLCPTNSRTDGHPDLIASDGKLYANLRLIVAMHGALPHLLDALDARDRRIAELEAERDNPEVADFMRGVPMEAEHQRARWGADHDAGKAPEDWFWLLGYLGGKALAAAKVGDLEKAKHHTISSAAALANWHLALTGADTRMRPGIDPARAALEARS